MAYPRWFLTLSIAVGLASLGAGWILESRGTEHTSASPHLASAEQMTKLRVKARTTESTSEKAMRARAAIKRGDYSTAKQIATDVLASSQLQYWRYYPFGEFINRIANANDPTLEAQLDAWVAESKNDSIPVLIRAQNFHDMGWFIRGHLFARETQASRLASFQDYMRKGLIDVEAAIRLNEGNPYSFYLRLRILRGLGAPKEVKNSFEEAKAKYPGYYPLYDTVLGMLQPKWGGSIAAMYAFVQRYAGHADEYSPLKLLNLSLYRHLLDAASLACSSYRRDKDRLAECVAAGMRKMLRPELESSVLTALQLYHHSDKHQFGIAVEAILDDMLRTSGGDAYSHAVLELAASSMNSDTQLKRERPGHNNYIIDKLVSTSWYLQGFYANTLKKGQDALNAIEASTFPSDEEKDLAISGIYWVFARAHNKLHQYPDIIAYGNAATALGSPTSTEHFICYGHYRLKAYDDAIRACTQAIENKTSNMKAYYWRGQARRDAGQADAALQDLTVVADSLDSFRPSAAIGMSMIYFNRNDVRSALDVLNKYRYLYDPEVTSRDNIAVSYNNRCYAYMQLDELSRALEDCTASLKYGNLPDAHRKHVELTKRLATHKPSLWDQLFR